MLQLQLAGRNLQYVILNVEIYDSFSHQQWFNLYAPTRLAIDTANMDQQSKQKASPAEVNQPATSLPFNALDVNRLFKGKTDKGKSKQSQSKKPPPGKTQNLGQSRGGQLGRMPPR